ncbi:MAG: ABC transporter substrate-binding protein [Proteobacteria bacterium]|nr:ABC transporter substrate-binding protein [Pseudomonadota bacterium]
MLRKLALSAFAGLLLVAGEAGTRAAEQQVVVNCSFELEWCEALRVKFEATTGLKAAIDRKAAGETMAQLRAEKGNPRFDVWHSAGVDSAKIVAEEGLLDSYQSPMLAQLHDWAKDAARTSGYTLTPINLGAVGFGYNADLLAKKNVPVPKCWADLTNPAFKGEIQMAEPASSATAYVMVTAILQIMGEDKGWAYLKALHPNINQYTRSGAAGIRAAGRGETTLAVAFLSDSVAQAVQGFPVKTVAPCEGSGFEMPGVAIIKNAKNPETARKWVDFVLSPDGQNVSLDQQKYEMQSNKNAKMHPLAPSAVIPPGYNMLKFSSAEERNQVLDRFEKQVKGR